MKLIDALLAARKEMADPRLSGDNPHFRSKFVPRDEVLDAVVPTLLKHGIVMAQGVFDGSLHTTIYSGDESLILSKWPLPQISDPQKFMAAVTYASRGSLMNAFGLAGDPDDDGNSTRPDPLDELRQLRGRLKISDDTYATQLETFGVTVDTELEPDQISKLIAAYKKRL